MEKKKTRAQVSIEFLFVVLYFLVLIGFIFTISGNFVDNQAKISIRNQETKIAQSISKILTASKGFEGGEYSVKYRVPKINVFGKLVEMPCEISVNANNIHLEKEYKGETIEADVPVNLSGTSINAKCGEIIEMSS